MIEERTGIKPELEMIGVDLYWICGFCNDPIYKIKDTASADVKYCPNYCPFCGARVDKSERGTFRT